MSEGEEKKYTAVQLRPPTFWEQQHDGTYHEIDPVTGAVVSVAGDLRNGPRTAEFIETDIDGERVMVQSGVATPNLKIDKKFPYSDAVGDVIAHKIMDGSSFDELHKVPGMPGRRVLLKWRELYPEFDEKVRVAIRARAEYLRDQALHIATDSVGRDKDEIPGRKLAVDSLWKAAEKDSPEVYGNKVQVQGNVTHKMIIDTGIRRVGDPGLEEEIILDVTECKNEPKGDELEVVPNTGKILEES